MPHDTAKYISRNHEFLTHIYGDYTMKTISEQFLNLLERLAEMFPKSHYQSELDRFITNKHPQNAADVEHFTKEFEYKHSKGGLV